jgi:hypothetical protein
MKKQRFFPTLQAIFLAALILVSLIWQGGRSGKFLWYLWIGRVPLLASTDAITRTAQSSFGNHFSDYLTFLRAEIPEDATVVIFPDTGGVFGILGNKSMSQYFLFPRPILVCRSMDNQDCLGLIGMPSSYVLYQNGFPLESDVPSKRLIRYTDLFGVFIP